MDIGQVSKRHGQGKLWGIDRVIGGTLQGKVGLTERANEGRERTKEGLGQSKPGERHRIIKRLEQSYRRVSKRFGQGK